MKKGLCVMLLMAISTFSFADFATKYVQGFASSYVLGPASSTITYVKDYNPNIVSQIRNKNDESTNQDSYQPDKYMNSKETTEYQLTLGEINNIKILKHKLFHLKLELKKINSIE